MEKQPDNTMLPVLTVTQNGELLKEFNGFGECYAWASKQEDRSIVGTLLGSSVVVILVGDVPLRLEISSGKTYIASTPYKETNKWVEL